MDLYVKESGSFTKVNEITATSGTTEFKVVLKNDNVYFNDEDETVRELTGLWTLIDFTDIVTKITVNSQEIAVDDFLTLDAYPLGSYSFTCKSGYQVDTVDYNGYVSSVRENYYAYLRIRYNGTEIYRKEMKRKSSQADGLKINGKFYNLSSEDIYYYVSNDEEQIKIEFINPVETLIYSMGGGLGSEKKATEPIILEAKNEIISLHKQTGPGSYTSICNFI